MSEIQIYSEGFELVINVDGVRVSLNLAAAEQLQAALAQAVPLLQKEHELSNLIEQSKYYSFLMGRFKYSSVV